MNTPIQEYNQIITSYLGLKSLWGDFGTGKTTFSLQSTLGTVAHNNIIIYLFSKPNFPFKKVKNLLKNQSLNILENIIFIKVKNFAILKTIILNIEFLVLNFIKEKTANIGLIVIDSLTDLYRIELNKEKKERNIKLNYELNQILATLSYIYYNYAIDILIVNELSRIRNQNQIIEVQTGKKLMDYWISSDLKIERTEILNHRKFILHLKDQKKQIEYYLDLTQNGFKNI